jgi:hypothetical protein
MVYPVNEKYDPVHASPVTEGCAEHSREGGVFRDLVPASASPVRYRSSWTTRSGTCCQPNERIILCMAR